jgi:Putative auto-transporter adhesin, head GIN domain
MRAKAVKALLVSGALVAGLFAAACEPFRGDAGPTTTETRTVEPFDRIEVDGRVDLTVRVGSSPTISLRGGEKALESLETPVQDGTLRFDPRDDGLNDGHEVDATVTVPRLEAVEAHGAGSIHLENLASDALELLNTGASDFTASGTVGTLSATVEGEGDLELGELEARDASVHISGVGDAEVNVIETLDAVLTGIGDIDYRGDPTVHSDEEGVGEIGPAEVE